MQPLVVVCLDGMGPDYVRAALDAGLWPRIASWLRRGGALGEGDGVLPSFTNPNNLSIVTGLTCAEHGLCGNHYFDVTLDREVSTDDPSFLRAETLLARLEGRGLRVGAVTSKEKLRRLLGAGRSGPTFSAERAADGRHGAWGIESLSDFVGEAPPAIYSALASTFVLRAGLALLRRCAPDVLYLSTTDYLQHRFGPRAPELEPSLAEIDRCLGALADEGALVAVTADHGMNAKPRIVWLGELVADARVVLPITDPYVKHHGALGSAAFLHVEEGARAEVLERLRSTAGVAEALTREACARRFALPADRLGDVVVFGDAETVFGKRPADHDLRALEGPLRSHGGPAEGRVPLLMSRAPAEPLPTTSRALFASALRAAGLVDL